MTNKKISCIIDSKLYDWIKDYQYTLAKQTTEILTMREIIEAMIRDAQANTPFKVTPRPDFLKEKDNLKAKRVRKTIELKEKQLKKISSKE